MSLRFYLPAMRKKEDAIAFAETVLKVLAQTDSN